MRAGAVQLNSTADTARNLETADRLVRAAAADGAELVVLPEKWSALGTPAQIAAGAEPLDGPAISWARGVARELSIDLVAGSIAERVEGQDKTANTSAHVRPDGELAGVYRKIHMFDVEVDGVQYRESEGEQPGEEIVVSTLAGGTSVGMSVCYDLRFPSCSGSSPSAARRSSSPRARSRSPPPAITGRCSYGPARSRTSAS